MERPPGAPAVFDVRTVVYLRRGDHPPELDEDASTAPTGDGHGSDVVSQEAPSTS